MHVGHEQVEEVLHAVFAYISMLRAPGGITEDRFEENRALSELRFRFADKSSPYSYVDRISSAMQTYDDRLVIFYMYLLPGLIPSSAVVTLQILTALHRLEHEIG